MLWRAAQAAPAASPLAGARSSVTGWIAAATVASNVTAASSTAATPSPRTVALPGSGRRTRNGSDGRSRNTTATRQSP